MTGKYTTRTRKLLTTTVPHQGIPVNACKCSSMLAKERATFSMNAYEEPAVSRNQMG